MRAMLVTVPELAALLPVEAAELLHSSLGMIGLLDDRIRAAGDLALAIRAVDDAAQTSDVEAIRAGIAEASVGVGEAFRALIRNGDQELAVTYIGDGGVQVLRLDDGWYQVAIFEEPERQTVSSALKAQRVDVAIVERYAIDGVSALGFERGVCGARTTADSDWELRAHEDWTAFAGRVEDWVLV
jgi:hypothetical protein